MVVGDADAPKSIVVYEDFLCPFCGQLEQTVGDQLDAAVEAGEVNVEYRPLAVPRADQRLLAGGRQRVRRGARRVGSRGRQGLPRPALRQPAVREGPFPEQATELVDLAVEAGATEADVRPGIEDMTFEGWVNAAGDAASKAGVNSTPTVFVDGEKVEGQTMAEIAEAMVGTGS